MLDNLWHKKERPFLGLTGMGGGVGSNLVAGGAGVPGMKATGGILHEYADPGGTKYRCHIFLQSGSLAVTEADGAVGTMDYLVVGGGGGASGNNGGGGGGGGVYTGSQTIAALTYPVTIGVGGKGTFTGANPGVAGNSDAPVSNGLQGVPSYFTDPSGPTTRTAGGGGGGLAWRQHISVGTLNGLSPGGSGAGAGWGSPGPGGGGNNDPGAQPGGGGGAENGGGGGSGGNSGLAGGQPNQRANGGDGYASAILGPYATSPAPNGGIYWGSGAGGCSLSINDSGPDGKGGVGGAGGGGCGSGDSPGGGPGNISEHALNWGWYARCDPGGSPRGNNGGDGGVGTGGGGGGGGRGRNASNQPNMVGPRNYNPTWQWNNGGGDGGPGCVIFRYALPAEYDLDYTKATGGFTHKVQDPTAADDGMVYHVMIDGCYGGPGPNQKANICDDNDCKTFTVGPTSFNAHIVMVGGGGGGGAADAPGHWSGGGGGGGLVLENPALPLSASMVCKYSVGHSGRGSGSNPSASNGSQWGTRGSRGDCTVFGNRTSPTNVQYHYAGGGGGGGIDLGPGGAPGEPVPGTVSNTDGGGSGGGGAGKATASPQYSIPGNAGAPGEGNTATPTVGSGTWVSYANNGGWARGPQSPGGPGTSAGGGGGAGGAGSVTPTDPVGGAGGDAKAMPAIPSRLGVGTPGPVSGVAYFAGGGGGGSGADGGTDSGGPGGGGGAGGVNTSNEPQDMMARTAKMTTGSGGGGGGSPAFTLGGPGGSGCIVIKYPSS